MNYAAPWWLPGGNLQTIWAALRSRRFLGPQPVFRRERWTTPDEDFVDVDWLITAMLPGEGTPAQKPLLVVFPRPRGLLRQPLRRSTRRRRARARLGLRHSAFPRLLGRTQPRAARLPFG
jgi:predicted alpha/beta-fold hydrolase